MAERGFLIVGLGNIGSEYQKTRHNVGFEVLLGLAKKEKLTLKKKIKLKGEVAQGLIKGKKVYLLKPTTYMNLSGQAVRACKDFFKIELKHIIVIVDDVHIPFGEFRLKEDSGTGGHKGLESIELALKTKEYPRLRIGVGRQEKKKLASYVLERFTKEEEKELPNLIEKAIEIIYLWLMQGIASAANFANIRKSTKGVKDET